MSVGFSPTKKKPDNREWTAPGGSRSDIRISVSRVSILEGIIVITFTLEDPEP